MLEQRKFAIIIIFSAENDWKVKTFVQISTIILYAVILAGMSLGATC